MELAAVAEYLAIGCAGGMLGSMLGLGGSTVVIPLATMLLAPDKQQLQAAAMVSNVAVALSALRRYHAMGAVDWTLARRITPWALVAVLGGVAVSVVVTATPFRLLFALFLLVVAARELHGALTRPDAAGAGAPGASTTPTPPTLAPRQAGAIGAAMGFISGLLGVGGGVVAVPLLRTWARLPVREAAATSVCAMVPLSAVGAITKGATLAWSAPAQPGGTAPLLGAAWIALALVPGALLGGSLGASMHKRLPAPVIHWVLILWLPASALGMAIPPILDWLRG